MEILNSNQEILNEIRNIHFVGIGGISMSALAHLSLHLGYNVSGSDISINEEVDKLQRIGVGVAIGHKKENIDTSIELVVYSGAISRDNPELKEAKVRKLPILERSEFLGEIAKIYDKVIAVAGSHGKTTTTAMIGHIFKLAKLNPTIHLGGNVLDFGNLNIGGREYFITEACEYRNSMKYIYSDTAVITNVDNDHLDYYKTEKNLVKAFQNFANQAKTNLIVGSERKFRQIGRESELISVGLNKNQNLYANNIRKTKKGFIFYVIRDGENLGKFKLNIWGKHNIRNSLYAIAVGLKYGIPLKVIKKAIKTFQTVDRRYQKIGKYKGITVISDYAHHPTEIRNSIHGLKSHFERVFVVFQPHTYSRTKILLKDFSSAFKGVKNLVVYKTYPAREKYDHKGDEKALFDAIKNNKKYLADSVEDIFSYIDGVIEIGKIDAIVVMGAGDLPLEIVRSI